MTCPEFLPGLCILAALSVPAAASDAPVITLVPAATVEWAETPEGGAFDVVAVAQ